MKAHNINENNKNKNDILNYKGYFVENNCDSEKKYYEFGAHFAYRELYLALMKLKSKKKINEKNVKILPKKKLNFERNNTKDKKIEENIKNIIKEFKIKTRSRNIEQKDNHNITLNKNLYQLTFVPLNPLNINKNKMRINNHININNNNTNSNHIINSIDNKLKQLNNKYNITRNRQQKYSFELPFFFTDHINNSNINRNMNINIPKEKNSSNNIINDNLNLYKSYQNQVKKRSIIKLNNNINATNNYNIIRSKLTNEKMNNYKKTRILSSNFDNYLNKYQYKRFKFSPLKNIQKRKYGENYNMHNFNYVMKKTDYNNKSNLNKNLEFKRFANDINIQLNKINSFSADKNRKYISNSFNSDKIINIQNNNISNISNNSQNNSKNITFQNMLQDISHNKKYGDKNKSINFNQPLHKSKIHNLFKLLNKQEKISRNKNVNYFLNNTSYLNYTQQNDKNKNLGPTKTKNIFLNVNNILMNKERKEKHRIELAKHFLNNSRNIINNKYFNTSYNLNNSNNINKIHATQNNNYNKLNIRKNPKKNNVNINININNNNKIIYNKIYDYKSPLTNISNTKIIKQSNPVKIQLNNKLLKNIRSNNISNNTNNKKLKYINIQLPKKKILNKYNKINNNFSNLFS